MPGDHLRLEVELVHRRAELRGKVRVASLENGTAVANIIEGWDSGEIAVGDAIYFDPTLL